MKYFEFGKENKKLMVILHGGEVSYRGALPGCSWFLFPECPPDAGLLPHL